MTATIPVGAAPSDIAATNAAIWVANYTDGTLSRIDPSTNSVVATIQVAGELSSVAADDKAAWAWSFDTEELYRIDSATNSVDGSTGISIPGRSVELTVMGGRLFAVSSSGSLLMIDPASGNVLKENSIGELPQTVTSCSHLEMGSCGS